MHHDAICIKKDCICICVCTTKKNIGSDLELLSSLDLVSLAFLFFFIYPFVYRKLEFIIRPYTCSAPSSHFMSSYVLPLAHRRHVFVCVMCVCHLSVQSLGLFLMHHDS